MKVITSKPAVSLCATWRCTVVHGFQILCYDCSVIIMIAEKFDQCAHKSAAETLFRLLAKKF